MYWTSQIETIPFSHEPGFADGQRKFKWFSSDKPENQNSAYKEEITYNLNKFGFRCKEFNLVDDYFLTIGCSFTFGVAIPEQHMWTNKVSTCLNIDNINFAIPGASNDLIVRYLHNYLPLFNPKFIVVQLTFPSRFEYISPDNYPVRIGAGFTYPKSSKAFKYNYNYLNLINDHHMWYDFDKNYNFIKLVTSKYKTLFITSCKETANRYNIQHFNVIDYGRDNSHPGVNSNNKISNYIITTL